MAIGVWALVAAGLVGACADEDQPADAMCSPGTEACACLDGGLCVAGLVCASGVCVDFAADSGADEETGDEGPGPKDPDIPNGDGDGDGDSGGGEFGSCFGNCGGLGLGGDLFCACSTDCTLFDDCCPDYALACPEQAGCSSNSDCEWSEVCKSATGVCVDALTVSYRVYVYWQDFTPDCFDSGLETGCLADVYMETRVGGDLVEVSGTYHDVTDVVFEPVVVVPNGIDGLSFAFSDYDEFSSDDFLNAVCVGTGTCGPLSAADLHTGTVTWDRSEAEVPTERFFVQANFVAQ